MRFSWTAYYVVCTSYLDLDIHALVGGLCACVCVLFLSARPGLFSISALTLPCPVLSCPGLACLPWFGLV